MLTFSHHREPLPALQGDKDIPGQDDGVIEELRRYFEETGEAICAGPVTPQVSAEEIRSQLASTFDFARPASLESVTAAVAQMMREWQVQITHPRYFGLFNPSVTLSSVIAETLVALYNPQLAAWRTSPGPVEMERHVLRWLGAKFGMPAEMLANFTTGGAEANLSAVIVALTRKFPGYGEEGIRSLPSPPVLYLTAEAHHSFSKIAHMTGLGRRAVRVVATDASLRMDLGELARRIEADRAGGLCPFLVVATAGTTSAGVIDPLPELGAFCSERGLWFHVDAAWAGAAVLSPRLQPLLAGIEQADSITCDAHKWFSVPMGCGMFFCRHPESVAEAFRAETAYMPGRGAASTVDPYTSTVQWSRRFIGLKLFLSLAERGEQGYDAMLEHQTAMGDLLRELLADAGWRIVNDTPLPLVCFTRDGLHHGEFLQALYRDQIAWMSETQLRGVPVLRACVTSFKTTEADVRWVVAEMNRIATAQHSVSAPGR